MTPEQLADVSLLVKNYIDSTEKRKERNEEEETFPGSGSETLKAGGGSFISASNILTPGQKGQASLSCVSMEGRLPFAPILMRNHLSLIYFPPILSGLQHRC